MEEYSGGKEAVPSRNSNTTIFECTIGMALVLLDGLIKVDRLIELNINDELHMIGEDRRGVLPTKMKAIQAGFQVMGVSATVKNLDEITRKRAFSIVRSGHLN